MFGRFAPSPTGQLHVGNLRTAVVAWLAARASGRGFVVRVEDLDRLQSSQSNEQAQLADLAALGLEWDHTVVRQSDRFPAYTDAIDRLDAAGLVYRCYCTRREIREEIQSAVSAPHDHLPDGAYPGICRDSDAARLRRRQETGRAPALRLRTDGQAYDVPDRILGGHRGAVDDVVLARADGVPAYNLAVVVDDAAQLVDQVVRGDDLLASTPRQMLLQDLLGLPRPEYLHVPLVVDDDGRRIAKRFGAVTLAELKDDGWSEARLLSVLAASLGVASAGERVRLPALVARFDPGLIPREPLRWSDVIRG